MPIVTVQQSPRELAPKRRLVAALTQAFVDAYDIRPEQVQVFIQEVGDENWAKAGKLAVDAGVQPRRS
jgi:4-oxalocrotonate tautomerase